MLESTYGDRLHEHDDSMQQLAEHINQTVKKDGVVIIPAFAVERTQEILYCLYRLKNSKAIPKIPIFLDSPLAIGVSNVWCNFPDEHNLSPDQCHALFKDVTFIKSKQESQNIDHLHHSAIIVAGSGMADGGRVLYHFKQYISQPKNTIIFVGYQSEGTNGHALTNGATSITIDGEIRAVHADIRMIGSFSAHADYNQILEWLSHFEKAPKKVFLTHGTLESARALQQKIIERFGWSVIVPKCLESFDLD